MNNKLADFVKSIKCGYSTYDLLLSDNDNIGPDGENLTIVVLSYNRSESTIALLDSIRNVVTNFKGKILIADNGSNEKEKNNILEYIKNSKLDIKLISFDKNYGVAGGRNKIIDYVETDWIMNLDNDIYFIDDPIYKIYNTILMFGFKFLNLPLLSEDKETVFSNGGILYVGNAGNGEFNLGGGSMFQQCKLNETNEGEPSISTFLFGGASVLHKQTFIDCGMFDDNMFIGFEDLDFSITLFNKGLKIGSCPTFSLVHNHVIDVNENSIEYEKMRFNSGILKESAIYFEKKRGFKIWDANLENWIKTRQKDLGIKEKKVVEAKVTRKPKIALIVDVEDWCFYNISNTIKNHLDKYYDFEIIPLELIDNNLIKLIFYVKNFDLVHFFWRGHLSFFKYQHDYINSCGLSYPDFKELYLNKLNITTSVYDHLYLDNIDLTNEILSFCKSYTVSSSKLYDIYTNNSEISKKPNCIITDGVDLSKFFPINLERLKKNKKSLTIGWVGNSAWSSEIEDFKGFNTILKPAITQLQDEGYNIKCYFADKQERMIPHDKMTEYYSKIDLYVCPSKIEGTPNPVLESMACGVPIISTDVGIVKNAFGKEQQTFILKDRSIKELKEKIKEIYNNPKLLEILSKENLKSIKKWEWKYKCEDFKRFFENNLKDSDIS